MTCALPACLAEVYCLGYCRPHYSKYKRWGNPNYDVNSITHKLLNLDRPEVGCWEWQGARNSQGYGQVWIDGRIVYVHRFMYEQHVGPIPDGYAIDHLCSNPPCARVGHLEAVTPSENAQRMWDRGERPKKTHCKWGHEFTPENTYRQHKGQRGCRACRVISSRERYLRSKAS